MGRSHGTSRHQPFDRWFRYPAGFATDYVARLLDEAEVGSGTVLDCFAGSGVTGTAARGRGLNFVGIEAHPVIADLADLKLNGVIDAAAAREFLREVIDAARHDRPRVDLTGETDLVTRSFESDTLIDLVSIRDQIKKRGTSDEARLAKWALMSTLRDVASVKVGWPYQRPGVARRARYSSAVDRFAARGAEMIHDLENRPQSPATARVLVGDASAVATWESVREPLSACVTSPPYLNNFDYADATRLELFFWGHARTWREMCDEVRSDMLTATTQQSSKREMVDAQGVLYRIDSPASRDVLALASAIRDVRDARGRRTKEYDQVTAPYFLAIRQVLVNAHPHLCPGAPLKWLVGDSAPYGVYIDTPRLIGEIAQEVGYVFEKDVSLRVRGNRWSQNADRHRHPLSERLITMRRS